MRKRASSTLTSAARGRREILDRGAASREYTAASEEDILSPREVSMAHVALVGPEIEENLSLRYIASSLAVAGYTTDIVPFNQEADFPHALARVLGAKEPPLVVG